MIKLKDLIRERKVLSVFDFDDTIAKSDAWIYVTRQGRVVKKLDPAEFAVYTPRPGEDFDFRDFDRKIRNPRLIKQNAELLRKQLDKARKAARGTRKVTILTARRLGAPVTSFLKTMGIDAYVVPLGSADPKDKADWIEAQIKKGYDTVYFMDDSNKNIMAVKNMLRRYPRVKSITKLIKESLTQQVPDTFYHATYKALLPSIKRTGLDTRKAALAWEDSKPGIVYLANDPGVAESYAEASEDVSDDIYDSGIVILKVASKDLDLSKLKDDSNVLEDDSDTYEYHGQIPWSKIKI